MKALVLSGGAFFGAYQAGVWLPLSQGFEPDVVLGASAGALNSWAIAGRCAPESLEENWRALTEFGQFNNYSRLETYTRRLHKQFGRRLRVGVVATELWKLRSRLFLDDEITWRHLAASCAVPILFPQPVIDGARYTDGGVLSPLPLWAARQMGATRIVAIDCMPKFEAGWMRRLAWPLAELRRRREPGPAPDGASVLTISPSRPLGGVADLLRWTRPNADRWISQGNADGAAALAELRRRGWTA